MSVMRLGARVNKSFSGKSKLLNRTSITNRCKLINTTETHQVVVSAVLAVLAGRASETDAAEVTQDELQSLHKLFHQALTQDQTPSSLTLNLM